MVVGIHWITPGWPALLRIPLLRGRMFTDADDRTARKVVLVSAAAAQRLWPGEDPIGRRVSVPIDHFQHDTAYVVGVLGDVLHGRLDAPAMPDIYVSYYQSPISFRMRLFLRTGGDPGAIAPAARQVLRE
ncbi:MAG: permease, partial [Geminicoccaceae bacterium]|nr:permease [Geminicoccaceae bacterium]